MAKCRWAVWITKLLARFSKQLFIFHIPVASPLAGLEAVEEEELCRSHAGGGTLNWAEGTVSTRPGALDTLLRLSPPPGLTKRLTIVRTSRILTSRYGHQVTKTLRTRLFMKEMKDMYSVHKT